MTEETHAKLSFDFMQQLRNNAKDLSSRIGSLALEQETDNPIYPSEAYDQMLTMYLSLRALVMLVDTVLGAGEQVTEDGKRFLLIDPPIFLKISECSQMSMSSYDFLRNNFGINLTVH